MIKPGHYTGELTLLLDIRLAGYGPSCGKAGRLFRLGQEDFWRMLSTCRRVAREIFQSAAD